jgi:hypothetical protein
VQILDHTISVNLHFSQSTTFNPLLNKAVHTDTVCIFSDYLEFH